MEIRYGILNPSTGQYEYEPTLDEAFNKIHDLAIQFYINHTQAAPISKVTINDDGSETWEYHSLNEVIPGIKFTPIYNEQYWKLRKAITEQ